MCTLGEREEHTNEEGAESAQCSLAKMYCLAAGGDDDELDGWLNSLGDSDEDVFNVDRWMNTDLSSDDKVDGDTRMGVGMDAMSG